MKTQRLLILTERFFPEEFLINDLASAWQARGWHVEVLTQVPSYPHDKIYDGYQNRCFQTTHELQEMPVHRVRTLLGYNTSVIKKVLNYLSFALLTTLWSLFKGWHYDRVFIYHTGPLTMATAALTLRFICRKPTMIWTQDVWPDTVYAYGFKQTKWKAFLLNTFVSTIYAACRVITVSSPSFVQKLSRYTKRQVHFIPQWTAQTFKPQPPQPQKTKRIFTFAGNLGSVQNLEMLTTVFGELAPENAELHLVGGGISLEPLRTLVSEKQYTNIFLPGRQPQSAMPELFAKSDVLIISLSEAFAMTLPAKFQAYIAAGKPIFGIIGGDTQDLIRTHQLGIACDPQPDAIRAAFQQLLTTPEQQLITWGQNARNLSESTFNRERIIEQMETLLKQA